MTGDPRRGRARLIGVVVVLAALGLLPSADAAALLQRKATSLPDGAMRASQPATPVGSCPRTEGRRIAPAYGFALGDGPVYAVGFGPDGVANYDRSHQDGGWFYVKVLWIAEPDYGGSVVVRGYQLDGRNELRFQEGTEPKEELRLPGGGPGDRWHEWPTHVRLRSPGCYAFRVEGDGFNQEIIFQAVEQRPEELAPLPQPGADSSPLPRNLLVASAVELEPGWVRLALVGAPRLVVRLDIGPSGAAPPEPFAADAQRLDTAAGPVLWIADPEHGWPRLAASAGGHHSFRMTVPDGGAGDWSEADLTQLVEAFAATEATGQG